MALIDKLGKQINVGDYVTYAVLSYKSAHLRFGKVLVVNEDKQTVTVQAAERTGDWNAQTRTVTYNKVVLSARRSTIMVYNMITVDRAGVPTQILNALDPITADSKPIKKASKKKAFYED